MVSLSRNSGEVSSAWTLRSTQCSDLKPYFQGANKEKNMKRIIALAAVAACGAALAVESANIVG